MDAAGGGAPPRPPPRRRGLGPPRRLPALAGVWHSPFLLRAAVVGAALGGALRLAGAPGPDALLLGWCLGALAYTAPILVLMRRATPAGMRRRAERLDESAGNILAACVGAAVASVAAVVWFLAVRRGAAGPWEVALALATIALSWAFVHVLFAVHYAHEYWQRGGAGVEFPAGPGPGPPQPPLFADFLYVAFTIGMTFQTSDVGFSDPALRRTALAHALVSFLFNAVIIAAAVNVAAGLVGTGGR